MSICLLPLPPPAAYGETNAWMSGWNQRQSNEIIVILMKKANNGRFWRTRSQSLLYCQLKGNHLTRLYCFFFVVFLWKSLHQKNDVRGIIMRENINIKHNLSKPRLCAMRVTSSGRINSGVESLWGTGPSCHCDSFPPDYDVACKLSIPL